MSTLPEEGHVYWRTERIRNDYEWRNLRVDPKDVGPREPLFKSNLKVMTRKSKRGNYFVKKAS